MSPDRGEILTEALRINASEVRWSFISDYYDGPIAGLAVYRSRLLRFSCFPEDIPDHYVYVLQELTPEELQEELRLKVKFEALVGTHFSFDEEGKPLPRILRHESLARRYYEEEQRDQRSEPDPRHGQIVAWFDVKTQHEAERTTPA